jgi:FMN phosphatase YigB (HAD superfamily)
MVSFVYFDVGGVIVSDLSRTNKWTILKRGIGIKPEDDKKFDEFWSSHEDEVCTGKNVEILIPLIAKKFHVDIPIDYSLLADFVNKLDRNESIWPVIYKIKQDCKVGLLTNIFPRMFSVMIEKEKIPSISWDMVIDSSIENCRKPSLDIFKIAERRINCKKENILFVDNTPENINVAKNFGWKTFLYDSTDWEKSSRKLLDCYNLLQMKLGKST